MRDPRKDQTLALMQYSEIIAFYWKTGINLLCYINVKSGHTLMLLELIYVFCSLLFYRTHLEIKWLCGLLPRHNFTSLWAQPGFILCWAFIKKLGTIHFTGSRNKKDVLFVWGYRRLMKLLFWVEFSNFSTIDVSITGSSASVHGVINRGESSWYSRDLRC